MHWPPALSCHPLLCLAKNRASNYRVTLNEKHDCGKRRLRNTSSGSAAPRLALASRMFKSAVLNQLDLKQVNHNGGNHNNHKAYKYDGKAIAPSVHKGKDSPLQAANGEMKHRGNIRKTKKHGGEMKKENSHHHMQHPSEQESRQSAAKRNGSYYPNTLRSKIATDNVRGDCSRMRDPDQVSRI